MKHTAVPYVALAALLLLGPGACSSSDPMADVQGPDPLIPAGTDCWSTGCGQTKISFCQIPIPPNFFDPGSLPFNGTVRLEGREVPRRMERRPVDLQLHLEPCRLGAKRRVEREGFRQAPQAGADDPDAGRARAAIWRASVHGSPSSTRDKPAAASVCKYSSRGRPPKWAICLASVRRASLKQGGDC